MGLRFGAKAFVSLPEDKTHCDSHPFYHVEDVTDISRLTMHVEYFVLRSSLSHIFAVLLHFLPIQLEINVSLRLGGHIAPPLNKSGSSSRGLREIEFNISGQLGFSGVLTFYMVLPLIRCRNKGKGGSLLMLSENSSTGGEYGQDDVRTPVGLGHLASSPADLLFRIVSVN